MRRSLLIAVMLSTTALTPSQAHADPISAAVVSIAVSAAASYGATALAGTALFTALFSAEVGLAIAGTLISVGLGLVANALTGGAGKPNVPKADAQKFNFAQAVTPMDTVFGIVRKGGPYALVATIDRRRYYGVILAAHRTGAIIQQYLDNRPVEVEANGEVGSFPFWRLRGISVPLAGESAAYAMHYDGAPGQVADPILVDKVPEWTTSHDMAGMSYVAFLARRTKARHVMETYGNSPRIGPEVVPAFYGATEIYDPRTDTLGWTDNAALVAAWIITARLGGAVDWAQIAIEADVCDILKTNRDGASQRQWTLNGSFPDNVEFEELRNNLIAACDGFMYERPDGVIGFKVGRYEAPTVTLTDDDFLSLKVVEGSNDPTETSEWVGTYVEPDLDWTNSATGAWVEDETVAVPVRAEVPLPFVDSHYQACHCLKRIARIQRAKYRIEGTVGMIGHDLIGERFVRITAGGYDFVAEVGSLSRMADGWSFSLAGASVVPEDFDLDGLADEPAPPVRITPVDSDTVPAPTALAGTAVAGPGIAWGFPVQPDDLLQELHYRVVGAAFWLPSISRDDGDGENVITTLGLVDGAVYEAEVRNVTRGARPSLWSPIATTTALADATPPAAMDAFSGFALASDVSLNITAPNSQNYAGCRIYRAVYPSGDPGPYDIADASLLTTKYGTANAEQIIGDGSLSAAVYAYWATPVNGSGTEGPTSGPVVEEI